MVLGLVDLYVSIGHLPFKWPEDFTLRCACALSLIASIDEQLDKRKNWNPFWNVGEWLMFEFANAIPTWRSEGLSANGNVFWAPNVDTRVWTAPDLRPRVGAVRTGVLVLCFAAVDTVQLPVPMDPEIRWNSITLDLCNKFQEFAMNEAAPWVRGVIVMKGKNEGWRFMYFDGGDWFAVHLLELLPDRHTATINQVAGRVP
ncbi:hypothetical protein F4777DRAFT_370532 [Nemania sp. FL0916]|nr:hypothetical protein F4777DRAFT_370532 [Nemania sp. FL0916]